MPTTPRLFNDTELPDICRGWLEVHGGDGNATWAENDGSARTNGVVIYKGCMDPENPTEPLPCSSMAHTMALNYLFVGYLYRIYQNDEMYENIFRAAVDHLKVRR